MYERICDIEGCGNLGRLHRSGKRGPLCNKHARLRSPAWMAAHRRYLNARKRDRVEQVVRQLRRGVQVKHRASHHGAVRRILGASKGDGLTASRKCPDDCPRSWIGHDRSHGAKVPYRLCIPAHYALEPHNTNMARRRVAEVAA